MRKYLSPVIDRLQAAFPPNRLMLILAGPIVAAAAWTSGFITANVPGVELPTGIVAGFMGAAVLIAVTLIYKWFDQWQAGEGFDLSPDLEAALDELANSHEVLERLVGPSGGIQKVLARLRERVVESTVNPAELAEELEDIAGIVDEILVEHGIKAPPEEQVASPATGAAPPTAPPAS